ncbi:hypothetical protein, partial [Salmonella enterica]|uniref:hypothetical protein n=1 Tax=Salmonella enterica TaxID=28901 RepID=UPI001C639676
MFIGDSSQYVDGTGAIHTNGTSSINGMYNGISQQAQMPMGLANGHGMGVEQALASPQTTMAQNGDHTQMGYENDTISSMPIATYSPQPTQASNPNGITIK